MVLYRSLDFVLFLEGDVVLNFDIVVSGCQLVLNKDFLKLRQIEDA